jgi:hypothetical protein
MSKRFTSDSILRNIHIAGAITSVSTPFQKSIGLISIS